MGVGEGGQALAGLLDCPQARHGGKIHVEAPSRKELRNEADIGQAG